VMRRSEAGGAIGRGGDQPPPGHGNGEGEEHLSQGFPLPINAQRSEPATIQCLREHEVKSPDAWHWGG
jgi:hypothetical protein